MGVSLLLKGVADSLGKAGGGSIGTRFPSSAVWSRALGASSGPSRLS